MTKVLLPQQTPKLEKKCRDQLHQIMTLSDSFSGKGGPIRLGQISLALPSQTGGSLWRMPWPAKAGNISFQFLPSGGSIGSRYLLQHLFSEKNTKLLIAQQPQKLEKKYAHICNPQNFSNFQVCLTKFKNYQILLNRISHKFPATTKLFNG